MNTKSDPLSTILGSRIDAVLDLLSAMIAKKDNPSYQSQIFFTLPNNPGGGVDWLLGRLRNRHVDSTSTLAYTGGGYILLQPPLHEAYLHGLLDALLDADELASGIAAQASGENPPEDFEDENEDPEVADALNNHGQDFDDLDDDDLHDLDDLHRWDPFDQLP